MEIRVVNAIGDGMKIRIEDNLFLNIRDTSFGTLSDKVAFVGQLRTFKKKPWRRFN